LQLLVFSLAYLVTGRGKKKLVLKDGKTRNKKRRDWEKAGGAEQIENMMKDTANKIDRSITSDIGEDAEVSSVFVCFWLEFRGGGGILDQDVIRYDTLGGRRGGRGGYFLMSREGGRRRGQFIQFLVYW